MILIDKNANTVLASGNSIDLTDNYALIDGKKYHEWKTINSISVDANIPNGKPYHWVYINGNFELTPSGVKHMEAQAIVELQKKQQELSSAVQNHIDERAKYYRYDDMKSARSYAGFLNAFQPEATRLGQWASECWVYAGNVEQEVMNGTRTMPTVDQLIAELPTLVMQ